MSTSRFQQALEAGQSRTLVLFGTSLTEAAWAVRLAAWLQTRYPNRARCINAALPGKASRTALDELDSLVLSHTPDCVLLEFAVNDATRVYTPTDRDFSISLEESRANLERMIARLQRARPTCEIVLQTMNPAWDAPNGRRSASLRPELAAYYDGYRRVAAERGLRLIDHTQEWSRLQAADPHRFHEFVPDGVHPSAEGSETITFPAVLAALFGESTSRPSRHEEAAKHRGPDAP